MPTDPPRGHAVNATSPSAAVWSEPSLLLGLRRCVSRRCPACGEGQLFAGYLGVIPICAVCGNNNEQ